MQFTKLKCNLKKHSDNNSYFIQLCEETKLSSFGSSIKYTDYSILRICPVIKKDPSASRRERFSVDRKQ